MNIIGDKQYNQKYNELKQQLDDFERKNINSENNNNIKTHTSLSYVYNAFADIGGGIITAFILNHIYTYFFGKNTIILVLLLILCPLAGLYSFIRYFLYQNNHSINQSKNASQNK